MTRSEALLLIGKKFNRWTVMSITPGSIRGTILATCKCDCGTQKETSLQNVVTEKSKGCRKCAVPKLIPICGHPERQNYAYGLCQACYKQKYFSENPGARERQKGTNRKSYAKYAPALNEESRERNIAYGYFLTVEEWCKIYDHQDGECRICGKLLRNRFTSENPEGKTAATDHCHITGQVRGLICAMPCNFLLGEVYSIEVVKRLLTYLENPPAETALGRKHFALPGRLGTKIWQKKRKLFKDLPRLTELGLEQALVVYKQEHGMDYAKEKTKE